MNDHINDYLNNLNADLSLDLKSEAHYGTIYSDFLRDFSPVECKYYSENQIKGTLNSYNFDYISCFSINIQSILAKFNNLCNFIDAITFNKSKISIIFLQEIWTNLDLNFNGFEYFFKARTASRGGGVAILINNELQCERIDDEQYFNEGILEIITCKIIIDGEEYLVSSVYHPPSRSVNDDNLFLELFNDYLSFLSDFELPVIFGSDINQDFFNINNLNSIANNTFNSLTFNGFISPITKATRLTTHSATLIDIIPSKNMIHNLIYNGVCTTDISDHLVPFNVYKITRTRNAKPTEYFNKRTLTPENLERFKVALAIQDWRSVLQVNEDVDLAFGNFLSIFLDLFNKYLPKKRIKFNRRTMALNDFMTRGLLKSRLSKQKLYSKFLSDRTDLNWETFRVFRNLYNKICRKAKISNIKQKVRDSEGNSKEMWNILKNQLGLQKKDTKIEYIQDGNRKVSNPQEMSDVFNSYISEIGPKLAKEVPRTAKSYKDYLGPRSDKNFYLFPISEYQLKKFIGNMSPKKSTDINDISLYLLNFVKETIAKPYTHIVNISFMSGKMPSAAKVSKTIIIHKGGSTHLLDQYRGVSLINSFGKIHEKIVYSKLLNFLESNSFIADRQFGFRKGRSTFHAILDLTNRLTNVITSGRIAMTILLDVRKCFDMLNRDVLLGKLEHFGIRGRSLEFFKSYFTNRSQKVLFKGHYSTNLKEINLGVLQGSILGVLFFILYVNDFQQCSDELLSFLFADDNVIDIEADNLQQVIDKANRLIPKIIEWYSANKLLLHPKKTKVLIVGLPRQQRFLNNIDLGLLNDFPVYFSTNSDGENDPQKITKLNVVPNANEKSVRHLGVMFDNELSFKYQFQKIFSKISKVIFSLNQMKNVLDRKHLKILYNSYVKSNIEYCSGLLVGAHESLLNPIIKQQKKCVRIISGSHRLAHTAELFKELKILPFDKLIIFNVCKFMHDYKYNNAPNVFNNTWKTNGEIQGRVLRNSDDYFIPHTNRTFIQNLPLFKYPSIWNSLPNSLKTQENKKKFISELNDYLLESIV